MASTTPTKNSLKQFKISRKKLRRALEKLNNLPEVKTNSKNLFHVCDAGIITQLNTSMYEQPIVWKKNWLNLFTTSITRHDWDTFIKTLRLASQNQNHCGVETVLRASVEMLLNTFFSVLAHPIYKEEKTLRLFLYTVAPCRSEQDIEFAIETIVRTFDGKGVEK